MRSAVSVYVVEEAPEQARARILRDVASDRRLFDLDQLVRELTAGLCTEAADKPLKPGDICPCCVQVVKATERVAIQHGAVLHERCWEARPQSVPAPPAPRSLEAERIAAAATYMLGAAQ